MSSLRKVLLAMLLVSLTGSAFGAGTFASFTATTTNAGSTFATGSLVLTNQKNSGNLCYSNGTAANNTPGASTDSNSNTGCDSVILADIKKPGDLSTSSVTINNAGTLAASGGLKLYAPSNCVDSPRAGETFVGTGSMCEQAELTVASSTDGTCLYGGGAAEEKKGTVKALPGETATINFTGANNTLTVNGQTITITTGTVGYSMTATPNTTISNPTLATRLADAFAAVPAANAIAGVSHDGYVHVASKTPGGTVSITGGTAQTILGLASTTTTFDSTPDATCAADPAYSVMNFSKAYSSTSGLTASATLPTSTPKTFVVGVSLNTLAGNQYQGRLATFGMTWAAAQ